MRFECWEFYGRGDQFFGGNADDRILYDMPDGSRKFLRSYDYAERKIADRALFDSCSAAKLAGGNAANWRGGLLSGIESRVAA